MSAMEILFTTFLLSACARFRPWLRPGAAGGLVVLPARERSAETRRKGPSKALDGAGPILRVVRVQLGDGDSGQRRIADESAERAKGIAEREAFVAPPV